MSCNVVCNRWIPVGGGRRIAEGEMQIAQGELRPQLGKVMP